MNAVARMAAPSDRSFATLACADAHDLLDCRDEDLAVADLARPRSLDDRLDRAVDEVVGDRSAPP